MEVMQDYLDFIISKHCISCFLIEIVHMLAMSTFFRKQFHSIYKSSIRASPHANSTDSVESNQL